MFFSTLCNLYKLRKLRKIQWLGLAELKKLQEKRLKSLIQHTYHNVSYYRKLFDKGGLKPDDIRTLNDLPKIPIASRAQLQAVPRDEIITKGINLSQCMNLRTSGSTGRPLDIFVSKKEYFLRSLLSFEVLRQNGYRITDKRLYILPPKYFSEIKSKALFQYFGIGRFKCVSIYDSPENWIKELITFKPDIIKGYTSSIKELALEIKRRKIKIITPRIVFCTADFLSQKDREFISSVFQAEVIDYYSANECGVIAWECREHRGYHINNSHIVLEIIDGGGNSLQEGEGKIVITNLSSFTMPFIRYEIGDWGILSAEQCPCGRNSSLLKRVLGRIVEFITLPTKTINPYHHLTDIIDVFPGIEQYQVIQNNEKNIKIQIVKNDSFEEEKINQLLDQCSHILDNSVDLEYEIVPCIQRSKSGKYKTIMTQSNSFEKTDINRF